MNLMLRCEWFGVSLLGLYLDFLAGICRFFSCYAVGVLRETTCFSRSFCFVGDVSRSLKEPGLAVRRENQPKYFPGCASSNGGNARQVFIHFNNCIFEFVVSWLRGDLM